MLITPLQLFVVCNRSQSCYFRGTLPHFPRSWTFRVELIELHLVFKRVHGREEALVRIRQELLSRNQTLEGFNHEFLAIMDMIEDLPTQHKVAAIDAEIGIGDRLDVADHTVGTQSDRVVAEVRLYGEEARGLAAPLEHIDELGQAHVSEAVAVIREEDLFILEVLLHGNQALPRNWTPSRGPRTGYSSHRCGCCEASQPCRHSEA